MDSPRPLISTLRKRAEELVSTRSGACSHRGDLKRDQRNKAIEQCDYVEKAACDVLGDDDRGVVVLRVPLTLDIPIFDRANDVGLIGLAQLDLDFVALARRWISQQKIE